MAGVNAKGACIGPMGARVRAVMTELRGEKIDIVDFDDDPQAFVASALSPARVSSVQVLDLDARSARVIVPDYQSRWRSARKGRTRGWRPSSPGGGSTSARTPIRPVPERPARGAPSSSWLTSRLTLGTKSPHPGL